LAIHDNQPPIQASGFMVEWRSGYPIDPNEYDQEADAFSETDSEDNLNENKYDAIDPDDIPNLLAEARVPGDQGAAVHAQVPVAKADKAPDYDDREAVVHEEVPETEQAPNLILEDDASCKDVDANLETTGNTHTATMQAGISGATTQERDQVSTQSVQEGASAQVAVSHTHNLCQRRVAHDSFKQFFNSPHSDKSYFPPRQFLQHGSHKSHKPKECMNSFIHGFIMNQMSANAGIKKHGRAAEAALMAEFAQLEQMEAYEAIDVQTLTKQQKKGALHAINLIKEKRSGILKGRTVADGHLQQYTYNKSQTASPTVSNDSLMETKLIDAYERQDVGNADMAGAYPKATMNNFVVMKFRGHSVDILCNMNSALHCYHFGKWNKSDLCPTKESTVWMCEICTSVAELNTDLHEDENPYLMLTQLYHR
jgi:hypothetical protein